MVPKKGLKIPKRYSLIRIPKSKDRQHNGQMKRDKRTNNNLKNYICGENDHGYVPCPFLIHACLITGFVPRVAWRVPLVEQELLTLLEDTSSPPGF
jgi:hypothetical protein